MPQANVKGDSITTFCAVTGPTDPSVCLFLLALFDGIAQFSLVYMTSLRGTSVLRNNLLRQDSVVFLITNLF